ncbi:DUF4389 domain-containing protein [Haliea sp. AH-315-K21]|uniref:DUF4389 domain-containing protein n=1 Tax=SAR86 cluster bacterium TaxID=2030880 RepID=A0A2A5CEF2_9GAMM|nr:DUF4389 domain-containing protein [Haliea sp. AH-315-K21]MBN4075202.1 DUF4389 domain-containing protein [Gammaproteobacteria bacterium AH-315-E17]PCJ42152.1 MAG: hypothetical protein COA71_06050 [SAR86 cluster bacterium]
MNEQSEQIKKNFLDQWIRLAFVVLYIIVFGLLWRFIAILLLVVIILQSLHRVVAAENNNTLLTFSEGLGNFLLKVLHYVLYMSDDKPIDFDAFFGQKNPKAENSTQATEENSAQSEEAEEVIEEAELVAEEGSEVDDEDATVSAKQTSAADDDVFADISFTEQTEDSTGNDSDEDNQPKKPD